MTPFRLLRRGLVHHAAGHAVAALAVAVATAVMVAALIVGDSFTATLRERALARLGRCTHLLTPTHPLREAEALLLAAPADLMVPLITLTGSVHMGDESSAVPDVDVIGGDARLWELFPNGPRPELSGRQAAINAALAADLHAKIGDELLVTVSRERDVPGGTLFAHHKRSKLTATLRLEVAAILPTGSAGDFAPWPQHGGQQRSLIVDRTWLAAQTGHAGTVTQVALVRAPGFTDHVPPTPGALGLRLTTDVTLGAVRVEALDLLFTAAQEKTVRAAAQDAGARCAAASIYLADQVRSGSQHASYVILAGIEPAQPFANRDGDTLAAAPASGTAWINTWLADDLAARVDSPLVITCPIPAGDGNYPLTELALRCAAVVDITGAAADRGLVPSINGITEADDLAHWDVPFPIDLARVTSRDDAYWDEHRTTPRLFVAPALLKELWAKAGGHGRWITSLTLVPPPGMTAAALAQAVERRLAQHGDRSAAGLIARPVRDEAIAASAGSTDLSQLFLGLGGVLILAAVFLAALVMRLLTEHRAHEIGVLGTCGFSAPRIRRLLLAEGAIVAATGAVAGCALGVVFAQGLLHLLTGAWSAAVGGLAPALALRSTTLITGTACGAAIGCAAVWWALRDLHRHDTATLILAGRLLTTRQPRLDQLSALWINLVAMLWVCILTGLALMELVPWTAACLGTGTALLVAIFANLWRAMAQLGRPDGAPPTWRRLVLRSIALHPQRSLAVTVLMAAAAFLLVAVAAQRRAADDESRGTGGYTLAVETPLPIGYNLATRAGRAKCGFTREEEGFFVGTALVPLLVAPGDDVSCRDPAAPQRPRLVGVPPALTARDGFLTITEDGAGWKALGADRDDAIPVYGDADSVRWILHAQLGAVREYPLDGGRLRLRIAGLITGSIFAGELLMSEAHFRTAFPRRDAPGRWLVAAPPERTGPLADILRRRLGPLGATVTPTRDIIASVLAVQNTYLAAFLALGGLGLALAAVGLAALLARTALERRWEWALLATCGVGRSRRALLLAAEHLLLVLIGLITGLATALIATAPALAAPGTVPAWGTVAAVLGLVLVAATLAALITAWATTDAHPADALRRG